MEHLGLIILLLAVMAGLSAVAPRLRVPYPVLLVLAGGALGLVPGLPKFHLDPEVIFLLFLPPLLYTEAYQMSWHEFRANLRPISLLAVGLVLLTTVGVAALAHYVIPGFGWALGFVLGAIVSPPDALAATSATKELKLPARLLVILDGEGLVNDASALITYRYAVAAVVSGAFAFWEAGWHFVLAAAGAIILGAGVGSLAARLQNRLTDATLITALTVLLPFGTYLGAEYLELSGVLAVVSMGLVLSRRSHDIYDNQTRLLKHSFWNVVSFLLNGLVFIFIGLELREVLAGIGPGRFWPTLGYGLLVSAAAIVLRIGWVFPTAGLGRLWHHWRGHRRALADMPGWRELLVTSWAGMRGVISLATALALPLVVRGGQPFPQRDVIVFITFTVIFATLVVQGLSLPWLVRRLEVRDDPAARAAEAQELRLTLATDSLGYLDTRLQAAGPPDAGLLTLRHVMQRQTERLRGTLAANESTDLRPPAAAERQAAEQFESLLRSRLDLTEHQRALLVRLHHENAFSEEAIRQVELELDRFEIALDTQLAAAQQPEPLADNAQTKVL